ncbi:NACHT, LRR and PYD domains-containing protein 3 [Triplophysa tibetana]|uniref:NACHT, LRR and PYD domains-containing protein 3 n=1 Tax=Triplophysa tibetana TaxID=1572043 RepID=A0A5A9MW81_9TELE|nr:NACHT, LRR and PYD domains-containing protein 3 [Triplophysa tibetana]
MSWSSTRSNKTFTEKKLGSTPRFYRRKTGPDTEEMSRSSKPSVSRRVSRIVAQGPEWTEAVDRYKMSIKQKYIQDEDQSLAKLYTEPVIVQEMRNGGFKNVHVDELFEPKSIKEPILILQGNSGSGKSYIAQKILLDWASGERYHKFELVFYLRCEELSLDAEVFTPEYIDRDDETIRMNKHRFLSPNAGSFRCSLTNLVFVMEGKGEMLYKIGSWDPQLLDGLGQMQPAGPLYNIDCFEGSISQLHLPHCEILSETKDSLAVARFIDGNVEILQPLKVTETHVIVDITKLSMFGLLKIWFPYSPVSAQVLLFLRPITVAKKQKILNVHLLPWNVPLPEDELFECNFGPNFHPTYQVFLDVRIEEVRLGLSETTNTEKEVWKQRRVPLSGSAFVDKHRNQLIQKVTSVMEIADCLRSRDMITSEKYEKVHTAEPSQEKMRILFTVLDSSVTVKEEFYRLLEEKVPLVVDELKSLELR